MPADELYLFMNDQFGRPFQEAAVAECRSLGKRLVVVRADPVRGMGAVRRRRTRMTRPIRERVEGRRRGCRVWLAEDINGERFLRRLPSSPDGVVTAYMQIFAASTIARFHTLVNLHPSLLPYYRGPAPVYWCLQNGEERSGYTLHEVTPEIDAGPILRQGVVPVRGTGEEVNAKIVAAAIPVVTEWIRHVLTGAAFRRESVDAGAIYRVREGYRTLADYRENERRQARAAT